MLLRKIRKYQSSRIDDFTDLSCQTGGKILLLLSSQPRKVFESPILQSVPGYQFGRNR